MKFPVAPFLMPHDGSVTHQGWSHMTPSGTSALPFEMDHWDYQTEINIFASVSINVRQLTHQCRLGFDSKLGVIVLARSSSTNVQTVLTRAVVPDTEECDVPLAARIAGTELGGRLTIETMVVALEPLPTDPLAATRAGSILWKEAHHTHLQGVGTQFPTDAEDFTQTRPDISRAGWILSLDSSDPDALFMSSVRLTLNSGHAAVRRLLAGTPDEQTRQLQRVIDVDVTRQLVSAALNSEDIMDLDVDWEAISLGGILRNLIQQIWPTGEDTQTLRTWLLNDPSRIESDIQHARGILG